jgi:hypothetical protein
LDAGAAALGNVDILVRSRPEVDPYISIMMLDPPIGWRRAWFLLSNDTDVPLSTVYGWSSHPHPNWEFGVAWADLHRVQPLLEIIRGLLQRGLTSVEILQTFFSCGVHSLYQREAIVQMSLGPSSPVHPFSTELGDMKINTRV